MVDEGERAPDADMPAFLYGLMPEFLNGQVLVPIAKAVVTNSQSDPLRCALFQNAACCAATFALAAEALALV